MAVGNSVLAVRYGHRVTSYAEMYLNYPLYGEPDADLDIAYYFWIIRDGSRVTLVDTGFAPEVGDRRRRALTATELVLTEAEYAFWTSPMAARAHFAAHAETSELAELARAREQGRVTLFSGELTLAPGVELIEVGGHTPGQLIVVAATSEATTPVVAADAQHV
jgi:glyoxylase-like metal-dependent hydrolase (beta-lactamase superfamily II)